MSAPEKLSLPDGKGGWMRQAGVSAQLASGVISAQASSRGFKRLTKLAWRCCASLLYLLVLSTAARLVRRAALSFVSHLIRVMRQGFRR